MTPLAKWEDNDSVHDRLVWWSRLDSKYQIEVQRTEDGKGATLVVFDHTDNDKVVFSEPTSLSYGAIFGPDVSDVEIWKERSCNVVDNLEHGED